MTETVQHFWSPPGNNEKILGTTKFQDQIIIITTDGVYIINKHGQPPPNWLVHKMPRLKF